MVAIKIKFINNLCPKYHWSIYFEGLFKGNLQIVQKVIKAHFIFEKFLVLFCLDKEKRKKAMNMTTAFLIVLISPVYSDNRGCCDILTSKIDLVFVKRKGIVER